MPIVNHVVFAALPRVLALVLLPDARARLDFLLALGVGREDPQEDTVYPEICASDLFQTYSRS